MAAPNGNTNAVKKGRTRVPVVLSIADERQDWVIAQLHEQGIENPTSEQIIQFVRSLCHEVIDMKVREGRN